MKWAFLLQLLLVSSPAAALSQAPYSSQNSSLMMGVLNNSRLPIEKRAAIVAIVIRESNLAGVDPLFVFANIQAESSFNLNAISNRGCRGLMQLNPKSMFAVAREVGFVGFNINNVSHNVYLGAKYLSQLLVSVKQNKYLAIAAYNAGPTALRRYMKQGRIPEEVRVHAKRVVRTYNGLRYAAAYVTRIDGKMCK